MADTDLENEQKLQMKVRNRARKATGMAGTQELMETVELIGKEAQLPKDKVQSAKAELIGNLVYNTTIYHGG